MLTGENYAQKVVVDLDRKELSTESMALMQATMLRQKYKDDGVIKVANATELKTAKTNWLNLREWIICYTGKSTNVILMSTSNSYRSNVKIGLLLLLDIMRAR